MTCIHPAGWFNLFMERKLWQKKWRHMRNLSQGGQGRTSIVIPIAGGDEFVLKELIRQDDPERRRRMALEVAALKVLTSPRHPGIATFVESNAEQYNDPVELFLVVEKIEGPNLAEYTRNTPQPLENVIEVMTRLLDAVASCHAARVLHRDIKPDNILMRNGGPDPVIIDFGLSFNEESRTESFASDPQQIIGNRFIGLPELLVGGQDRHSFVSDITQCLGILFFLLTGHNPVTLRDAADQPPHRRKHSRDLLLQLAERERRKLDQIFNKGFRHDPTDRWQTVADLRSAITNLASTSESGGEFDFQSELAALGQTVQSSPSIQVHKEAMDWCREIARIARTVVAKINQSVQGACQISIPDVGPVPHPKPHLEITFFVSGALFPKERPALKLRCELSARDVVVSSSLGKTGVGHSEFPGELENARFHVFDPVEDLDALITDTLQRILTAFIRPFIETLAREQ